MPTFQKDIFRDRLKFLRKQKKLTQDGASKEFGVSRTCYSSWELGQSCPPLDDLFNLCVYFEVSADYLLGLNDTAAQVIQKESPISSILDSSTQRDPFSDLTPDQRIAIESALKAFREHNAAKEQEA